jgi:2-polyprenyl-3-methyl-5-hydroxy-6-metoxy-1,4-benzoquinol methylase
MMTKKLHNKISSKFKGRVYHNWGAVKKKVAHLRRFLKLFKGRRVLEIGCNAGIASFDLANSAKSYLGIEAKENYYKQALTTKKYLRNKNVEYRNQRFEDFVNKDNEGYDALYVSYVLYHLDNDEIKLLKNKVLSKCDLVMIYSRHEDRKKLKNKYRLEREKNIAKFLENFKTKTYWSNTKSFFCVLGRRKNGKDSKAQGQAEENQTRAGDKV